MCLKVWLESFELRSFSFRCENKADYFGQARHFLQILNFRFPEANDGKIQLKSNLKNVLIQNPISYLNSNKFNSRICKNVSEIGKLNIFSF